jgi:GT2 family glycosyltransferase
LLDQDDIWYPHHLEHLARPFRRKSGIPLGWVYSNLDQIDEDGGSVRLGLIGELPSEQPKRSLAGCLSQNMYVLPSASLISRTAFEAVGGFDERLCGYEDDDLFLRLFRAGYDNTYLRERLSKWRIHESSCCHSDRMAISLMIYARKLLATFPDEPSQGTFWARDVIIPRFLRTTTSEYRRCLWQGDVTGSARLLADVKELVGYLPTKPRVKFRFKVLGKWVRIRTTLPRHLAIRALTRMRRCELA